MSGVRSERKQTHAWALSIRVSRAVAAEPVVEAACRASNQDCALAGGIASRTRFAMPSQWLVNSVHPRFVYAARNVWIELGLLNFRKPLLFLNNNPLEVVVVEEDDVHLSRMELE